MVDDFKLIDMFKSYLRLPDDGSFNTNKISIPNEQCSVCLNDVVQDWRITISFVHHVNTKKAICTECISGINDL